MAASGLFPRAARKERPSLRRVENSREILLSVSYLVARVRSVSGDPMRSRPEPDAMSSLMDSPLTRSIFENPEFMRQFVDSSPQLRGVLEANPQLRHALADPQLMREAFEVARSPARRAPRPESKVVETPFDRISWLARANASTFFLLAFVHVYIIFSFFILKIFMHFHFLN